jgi:hypothetical protein
MVVQRQFTMVEGNGPSSPPCLYSSNMLYYIGNNTLMEVASHVKKPFSTRGEGLEDEIFL